MASDRSDDEFPAWEARKLLRAARVGTLATVAITNSGAQPFAALVTPATAPDLSVLLWLSSLSEHTRQLAATPRCALLVVGEAREENPQTAPRLSVTGRAEPIDDPALKARWLARHPYATLYADFADFALWRIRPTGGQFVGGFARATRLRAADLTPDPAAVTAIAHAAAHIITHCNRDHPAAMTRIAHAVGGAAGEVEVDWRMVAVDVDGFDLASGDLVRRIAFAAPVAHPDGVRAELIRLAKAPSMRHDTV